eukprot:4402384-Ditylum_brightwellii.AAC.1
MLSSGMWTPKVPSKKKQDEPDLSTTGLQAAVKKAIHTSLQKIGSKSKQSRNQCFSKQSFSDNECCNHCNEKGHKRKTCPHKNFFGIKCLLRIISSSDITGPRVASSQS